MSETRAAQQATSVLGYIKDTDYNTPRTLMVCRTSHIPETLTSVFPCVRERLIPSGVWGLEGVWGVARAPCIRVACCNRNRQKKILYTRIPIPIK